MPKKKKKRVDINLQGTMVYVQVQAAMLENKGSLSRGANNKEY